MREKITFCAASQSIMPFVYAAVGWKRPSRMSSRLLGLDARRKPMEIVPWYL